ncbi:uncharacterized protein LOC129592497 [Paramacrobiotus metropolitanus]|uniref:uncharacterized protein LOC129592497 n=1 Tax=Paramacrobiotus metropolitanus TaxID=2943436 RepID=UPI002445B456|nr:uncharacterized protein LOC129592497 [Paramacrobiotus metropolitanus]
MKLAWLNTTGTLIVSTDDASIIVLCRKKSKRLRLRFHRLVFHFYHEIMERYFRKGHAPDASRTEKWFTKTIDKLLFFPKWLAPKSNVAGARIIKGTARDQEALPALQALPDILLRETFQSMDGIAQRDLKRVCWRWCRLQSSVTTEKYVMLEAPDYQHVQPVHLANAMLQYIPKSTRNLLLIQYTPSHGLTAMRLIKEMQLQLRLYASYRTSVHYPRAIHDLEYELELYPTVNNFHIFCTMKSKKAERITLEIIIAAPDEIKSLLNVLGAGGWTYCCTTETMKGTVTGISQVLDALNLRCSQHGKLTVAVDCPHRTSWEAGERLKEDLQAWPISSAAFDVLTRGFEDYCPPSTPTTSYCEFTGFRPEVLKVLIRKPCMIEEEYFSSCGVQSWLRFA